eukprot:s1155_g7.t2
MRLGQPFVRCCGFATSRFARTPMPIKTQAALRAIEARRLEHVAEMATRNSRQRLSRLGLPSGPLPELVASGPVDGESQAEGAEKTEKPTNLAETRRPQQAEPKDAFGKARPKGGSRTPRLRVAADFSAVSSHFCHLSCSMQAFVLPAAAPATAGQAWRADAKLSRSGLCPTARASSPELPASSSLPMSRALIAAAAVAASCRGRRGVARRAAAATDLDLDIIQKKKVGKKAEEEEETETSKDSWVVLVHAPIRNCKMPWCKIPGLRRVICTCLKDGVQPGSGIRSKDGKCALTLEQYAEVLSEGVPLLTRGKAYEVSSRLFASAMANPVGTAVVINSFKKAAEDYHQRLTNLGLWTSIAPVDRD